MRYLIKPEAQLKSINQIEADFRGCEGQTEYWYEIRLTASGDYCMIIDDDKIFDGDTTISPDWPNIN